MKVRCKFMDMFQSVRLYLAVLVTIGICLIADAQIGGTGWAVKPVTFHVQWPYNVPKNARYWFTNGIYHCLVRGGDKPFAHGNHTKPRTEQRFTPDYTQGEIQYQARLMMPSNEDGYCIFQIHTGNAQSHRYGATTFMLFWFRRDGGSLHFYDGVELANHLGGQWFQLNVDHNLATRTIKVWINRKLVWTQRDNGAGEFYLKDGVYQQGHDPSLKMETSIADLHIWTKSGKPAASPTSGKQNYDS